MRIVIVTDAWYPQVNGVVRTLSTIGRALEKTGDDVRFITPASFKTLPCPTYPEIRLSLATARMVGKLIEDAQPCAIHISTEGPLGLAARRYCLRRKLPFTTAYHTRFPEYVAARMPVPARWTYKLMRWFHGPSSAVMAPTETVKRDLEANGLTNVVLWGRGVDTECFRPREARKETVYDDLPRPVFLYVGRVAVEKNITAFLDLDLPGAKVVVGDGPQLEQLREEYREVNFLGAKSGEDLARHYADADVFVFPSRTDTFGLVLLEALASGVPVAAYPVTGPLDVIGDAPIGVLDEDLGKAARAALSIDPKACRDFALKFSWAACAEVFRGHLLPFKCDLAPDCAEKEAAGLTAEERP